MNLKKLKVLTINSNLFDKRDEAIQAHADYLNHSRLAEESLKKHVQLCNELEKSFDELSDILSSYKYFVIKLNYKELYLTFNRTEIQNNKKYIKFKIEKSSTLNPYEFSLTRDIILLGNTISFSKQYLIAIFVHNDCGLEFNLMDKDLIQKLYYKKK